MRETDSTVRVHRRPAKLVKKIIMRHCAIAVIPLIGSLALAILLVSQLGFIPQWLLLTIGAYLCVMPVLVLGLKNDLIIGYRPSEKGVLWNKGYLIPWKNIEGVRMHKYSWGLGPIPFLKLSPDTFNQLPWLQRFQGRPIRWKKWGLPLPWPVEDPDEFRQDVLACAPQGHPLRTAVETGEL